MNIQEIHIKEFPVVIFSDSHTNLANIKKLQELYPHKPLISLGDFTFLFAKPEETYNAKSIQFFINHKIPCLLGNHEQHIINCAEIDNGNSLVIFKVIPKFDEHGSLFDSYGLSKEHLIFLKNLPIGFKLLLPNGSNYYCFHNEPKNLWNFPDKITEQEFKDRYVFDDKTIAVLQGHLHLNLVNDFHPKRICIGQLCGSNHHTGENNGNNYALLTENGIEFKKI